MDVLFINSTAELSLRDEANGTMLLGTKLLQAGFNVKILRFCQIEAYKDNYSVFIDNAVRRILDIHPKCVSLYCLWPYYHTMLRICQKLKQIEPTIITVLGGPQASLTAAETMSAMEFIDYICTGEGENTCIPFFECIIHENGNSIKDIPGLYYRQNGCIKFNSKPVPLADLNTLPHWDDRLLEDYDKAANANMQAKNYYMPIDAGRGCPFNCTFCCTSLFLHRSYRLKSPERILEDISYFSTKFGIKSFSFAHDAFTTNKKLVEEICNLIIQKKLDITWKCTSRIDLISKELIQKMKAAGMVAIELGIESGSERMQKIINKRLDLSKAKEMSNYIRSQGIKTSFFFIYGFPEETEEDLNRTLELFFNFKDDGAIKSSMALCRFYPKTVLTQQYFSKLKINPKMKKLSRGIFGYDEEKEMFEHNKAIFPYYYDLSTPLRHEYQYIYYLAKLYSKFPKTIKYLRELYKGDNLLFYRDFYQNNTWLFDEVLEQVMETIDHKSMYIFENMLKNRSETYTKQILGLLKFEHNSMIIFNQDSDVSHVDDYDFNYIDFKTGIPIDQFSDQKSRILLEKKDGKNNLKILNIF